MEENAKFTNKADIFALGCILYEVATGKRLFSSDWAVREYFLRKTLDCPVCWPSQYKDNESYNHLYNTYLSMIQLEPTSRLRATDIQVKLTAAGDVRPKQQTPLRRLMDVFLRRFALLCISGEIGNKPRNRERGNRVKRRE